MENILISSAQLRACQVLRREVEGLITVLDKLVALNQTGAATHQANDWLNGEATGRSEAYRLAAQWLREALTEADR